MISILSNNIIKLHKTDNIQMKFRKKLIWYTRTLSKSDYFLGGVAFGVVY